MLRVENVWKTFNAGTVNEKTALSGLNLHLNEGDFVTVIGGNGAGKSTMLNAVAGVWPVDEGKIFIDNVDVTKLPEHKRAAYLGRVFQDPMTGTAAGMQIEENMALAARRGAMRFLKPGITQKEREYYKERLSALGLGLEDRLTSKVGLLSGGQRQAVTLLMAAIKKPKLLLLDEHTAALDPKTAKKVLEISDKIIEENQLFLLDRPDGERLYAQRYGLSRDPEEWFSSQSSLERPAETSAVDPDNYRVTINAHQGYNVYVTNGVHYVLAKENDTFENIGRKFRLSPRNLRKFNDLKDKKAQPVPGEAVYIERKRKRWEGNSRHHICRQGETAYSVGQSYAIRTRSIEKLNKLRKDEELAAGREIRIK